MALCSICLSSFKDPVCIPCGHVYCKRCLTEHANAQGNSRLSAKCPDCRASFDLVLPDLTYLPEKYHKFVSHNVRRLYVDFSAPNSDHTRDALKAAEARLARKAATEQALLRRCEELTEAVTVHREGERDANVRILDLENDLAALENLVEDNNIKARTLQGMLDSVMLKVNSLEETNKALQKENARLPLTQEEVSIRGGSSSIHPSFSRPVTSKRKGKKYIVHLPPSNPSNTECTIQVSSSDDTPLAISMSNSSFLSSASTPSLSRPMKPLPKRHGIRKRLIGDSSYMSIDVSDFV